jgi:hypothetical protein
MFQPQKGNDGDPYCQDFPGFILLPPGTFRAGGCGPATRPRLGAISRMNVNIRLRIFEKSVTKICLLAPETDDRFPTVGDNPGVRFEKLSTWSGILWITFEINSDFLASSFQ